MTVLETIKKALEGVGPLKVEFTPDCDEFNAIIAPINDDYDGTFFTVIGCGDKQDKLGGFMAVAVNTVQELVDTIESLQRENEELRKDKDHIAAEKAGIAKNAHNNVDYWKSQAEAAEAEVKRLQAEIDRKSSMPGDHRYWEGRYRDEAAENEKLREALKPFAEASAWNSDGTDLMQQPRPIWPNDIDLMSLEGNSLTLCDLMDARDALAREQETQPSFDEKLREALKPFSQFAGVLFERNFNRTDSVAEMTDVDDIPHVIFAGSFFDARTALASTGGEHHGN